MIGNLTRNQIAKLPVEQQEALARVVLDESRNRRLLQTKAKGYWGMGFVPILVWIFATLLCLFIPGLIVLILPTLALLLLVQFHVAGINRRIDAFLLLLNLDRVQEPSRHNESSTSGGDMSAD